MSIKRQCELLEVPRSSYYHDSAIPDKKAEDELLMRKIYLEELDGRIPWTGCRPSQLHPSRSIPSRHFTSPNLPCLRGRRPDAYVLALSS